ncbi:transporter substrate-binding domain-containing protein [Amphritea atlantica]|uniref:Transporter substrate-binding domain-containing protein n=1 Tax=Amphritea atlantica TaxID=355243 RepID=A0ABY5GWQ7_9GAMM|nr:transporter substrate-binding domain-containing protein [Amphritea atlantica]
MPLVSAESAAVTVDQEIVQRVRQKLILSKQQKDWLAEHPVIRVGVDAGYAPYSFLDASGNFTGVVPDYLNILSMSLGVAFKPVPDISWQEIIADAKTRDLDLIATAVITPEREKYLDFSQMYLPTPLVIMTQRDNRAITSTDRSSQKKWHNTGDG